MSAPGIVPVAGRTKADGSSALRRPTVPAVARELQVFSGNECAFDGCTQRLVTPEQGWVGVVAHIIGAEPKSARHEHWDGVDLDDLRSPDNLILLCATHSVLIDSPGSRDQFTVEYLRAVKARHEQPYRYGMDQLTEVLEADLRDAVKKNAVTLPVSLRRFLDWEDEHLDTEQEAQALATFTGLARQVGTLTRQARRVLSLLVELGDGDDRWRGEGADYKLVQRRLSADRATLVSLCDELTSAELAVLVVDEWGQTPPLIRLMDAHLDGVREYWDSLRRFAVDTGTDLDEMFVDLDFSLLDAPRTT